MDILLHTNIFEQLRRDEGCRLEAYEDTVGILTRMALADHAGAHFVLASGSSVMLRQPASNTGTRDSSSLNA